jgi:hypothetical protein
MLLSQAAEDKPGTELGTIKDIFGLEMARRPSEGARVKVSQTRKELKKKTE